MRAWRCEGVARCPYCLNCERGLFSRLNRGLSQITRSTRILRGALLFSAFICVIRVIRDSDNERLHSPINFLFSPDTCRPAGAKEEGRHAVLYTCRPYRAKGTYLAAGAEGCKCSGYCDEAFNLGIEPLISVNLCNLCNPRFRQ